MRLDRRKIAYGGDTPEVIVLALYLLKEALASIFDRVFDKDRQDLMPSEAAWLQSELHRLVASAAQEKPRLYLGSTATSFYS